MHKPEGSSSGSRSTCQIWPSDVVQLLGQQPKLGNLFDRADCSRGANASESLFISR